MLFGLLNGLYLLQPIDGGGWIVWVDVTFYVFVPSASYVILAKKYGFSLRDVGFLVGGNAGETVRQAVICSVALIAANWLILEISWALLWQFDWVQPGAPPVGVISLLPTVALWRYLCILYLVLSAAIIEEVYYRGILLHCCRLYLDNPQRARVAFLVISATLFGLSHWEGGLAKTITMSLVGLLAARLYLWTKNILPLIVGHFAMNVLFI